MPSIENTGCTEQPGEFKELELSDDEYECRLDDIYDDVSICGLTFSAGYALRQLDPVAFRCGKADEPQRYECCNCGDEHDDETDAGNCCPVYACDVCGEEHDDETDADECCPAYVCDSCGTEHDCELDAEQCEEKCDSEETL